ncbi:urate hydroxylase PuuD [Ottowia sp.]|uniref:urate hydroxylase PuuD n=2 Tax=Ottowia sp. TaxID=1898956 RepID=UPI002BC998F3|nr:urate hydroxylase PuuD [Ottowia sp.]HOB65873.1 urate hydroxylase PuuD [Ottowia sp.]HQD47291.1 urate hydroxylase PuuD [Ottowia sp.]
MEAYLLDWANLLLRWLHVVVAIAWIGSSFYFVFLDNNLLAPTADDLKKKGVDGAMWAVHGGGFYNPQKYMVAPKGGIDSKLHWFYWESYSTWLSGFALFCVLYLWNASAFLVDRQVLDWSPAAAGLAAVAFLVGFWVVYDAICRVFGFRPNGERIVGALLIVVVAFSAWLACHLFSGRAAFLIVGAMLATAMSANVFFWIIPGQRKVVAAMTSGQPYDASALAIHGQRGKQRSVHNTYFTLPVVFAMLSNHYSFLYSHPQRWLVLCLMMLAGALIRQFFVQRHGWHHGRAANPWPYAAAGVLVLLGVMAWLRPAPAAVAAVPATVGYAQLRPMIEQRCQSCHGEAVQMKNLRFDSQAAVEQHAQQIFQQVVVTRAMPLSNATQMTDGERAMVARWFEAQAKR